MMKAYISDAERHPFIVRKDAFRNFGAYFSGIYMISFIISDDFYRLLIKIGG
jgi:hypothetical protein